MKIRDEVLALLHRVPVPPEDTLPTGASEDMLNNTEKKHRIVFTPMLREWLLTSNGACVGPGGLVGLGAVRDSQNLTAIFENYPTWREKGWVPVAGDGCGSYYVVATRNEYGDGEPVLFIDVNELSDEPAFIAASNIWRFLRFLLAKELDETLWPYNESGTVGSAVRTVYSPVFLMEIIEIGDCSPHPQFPNSSDKRLWQPICETRNVTSDSGISRNHV